MRKILLITMLLVFLLSSCTQSPTNTDDFLTINEDKIFTENTYYLDLELDEVNNKLLVEGQIVYVNDEMDFDELYLKIYPNAYSVNPDEYNVTFEYLMIEDIEYTVTYSGTDNTTIHLDLEETLPLGETFTISFGYEFTYWDFGRIGLIQDVYYTMFFYPFVAMYDDGWQIDSYTFRGESYYNEIGDYYVSLLLPSDYKLGASGNVLEKITEGEKIRYNMFLNNGRDFSFSTSNIYREYTEKIDDIDYKILSVRELSTSEVNDSFDYLSYSFDIYQDYVGEYYYNYFTLEYGYIYGMESSGLIFCSEEISEYTVVHEVIHQWFYSMIGNDQSNYSFIDEALTTYTTFIYFYERYGQASSDGYLDYRSSLKPELSDRYELYEGVSLLQQVNEFGDGYGYIIYYHGPTIFRYYVDEFLSGDYTVLKTYLNNYYNQYQGKEVSLDEMLDLLETTTGIDNTKEWFVMQINNLGDLERLPE